MATERQANLTLEYHQEKLFQNQNLAYLAVVSILDENGEPTSEFIIEAGVYNETQQKEAEKKLKNQNIQDEEFVPLSLAIPNSENTKILSKEFLDVNIIPTKGFSAQSFTDRKRPANGGCSVMNYRFHSAGTLGAAIRLRGQSGLFFISNWHVLNGGNGRIGDSIIQPGRYDGGRHPQDKIATLYWSRLDSSMDAAVAKVEGSNVSGGTRCFGTIRGVESARVNTPVKKCGRTTRLTTGRIRSTNASVRVSGYPGGVRLFTGQILTTHMSQGGDSGSVICNANNNKAIGLLFAGDGRTQTIANHINKIIGTNFKSFETKYNNGEEETMPDIEIVEFA